MSMQLTKYFYLSCLFVAALLLQACAPQGPVEVHLQGQTMGTTYNVKFVPVAGIEPQTLQQELDGVLLHINRLMSTYDPDSELSHFNQWQSNEPFPLSEQTLLVMQEAKRLGELSHGVLDVTVGPLVNLWGFGPNARPEKVPSEDVIADTQRRIGLEKLYLTTTAARKLTPDLYVDLSTIAKGYAVDELANTLEQQGLKDYLVEVGGEMRVAGHKADGSDWRIAVEKPVSTERAVQRIMVVGDNAIATSGDYRNYYEENGRRYSHLIDPRTGYPINHNLVAVTVVHPSSMTADGLATALNVMGYPEAMQLAERENLAVLLITRENDGFNEYTSAAFDKLVRFVQ